MRSHYPAAWPLDYGRRSCRGSLMVTPLDCWRLLGSALTPSFDRRDEASDVHLAALTSPLRLKTEAIAHVG